MGAGGEQQLLHFWGIMELMNSIGRELGTAAGPGKNNSTKGSKILQPSSTELLRAGLEGRLEFYFSLTTLGDRKKTSPPEGAAFFPKKTHIFSP